MSIRDTIVLNPTDLKYLLIDSLRLYSDNVEFISGKNPYKFSINKKCIYILIKNVHESGANRGNEDECRIQISKSKNFNEALSSNNEVVVFGYFADEKVFTAWNPYWLRERFNKRQTISKYSRFSVQRKASTEGIASYIDNNDETIISFKPDYLGLYLDNISNIHLLNESNLLELIKLSDKSNYDNFEKEYPIEKEKYQVTHKRYKRDPRFKKIIYDAYDHRCAMCGIQLELIEAAHIVPHSHNLGTDDAGNGIALCVLHHKAYDKGLIYFDIDYNIKINTDKIKYLEKIKLDSGYRKFTDLTYDKVVLPLNQALRPIKNNINIANTIRGIIE